MGTKFLEYVEESGRGLESGVNTTDVEFTLREENGVTRLTQRAEMQLKGPLKITSLIFGPVLMKGIRKQALAKFSELKRLCESED